MFKNKYQDLEETCRSKKVDYFYIDEDLQIRSIITDNAIKQKLIRNGYFVVQITHKKKTYNAYVHRLLALVFIPKPERLIKFPFSKLQVNHINGLKTDNRLENLEWVTSSENRKHAYDANLQTQNTQVIARNILTGQIFKYISIKDCAEVFQIDAVSLGKHISSVEAGTRTVKWVVFKNNNETPWPIIPDNLIKENTFNRGFVCVGFEVSTGNTYVFEDFIDAANKLKLNYDCIKNTQRSSAKNKVYEGWIFDRIDIRNINSKAISTLTHCPVRLRNGKKICVFDKLTNTRTVYASASAAARALNTNVVRILSLLKNKQFDYLDFEVSNAD